VPAQLLLFLRLGGLHSFQAGGTRRIEFRPEEVSSRARLSALPRSCSSACFA
jgi:hypothetical protein